jgi:hypothetical protein
MFSSSVVFLFYRKYLSLATIDEISATKIIWIFIQTGGTRWRSWLVHSATNRKVAGSIPYGVNGNFH